MIKILSFFIFLFTTSIFSQNYKITYDIDYYVNLDTIKYDKQKLNYEHILKGIKNIKGVLTTNGAESNFIQNGYLTKTPRSEFNLIDNYYSDRSAKRVYSLTTGLPEQYDNRYYNFTDFDWKITKETKKIENTFVIKQ